MFLFESIENPPTSDHEDQLTDILISLVLAFNLHFGKPKDNLVMQVMEDKKTAKVFTEKILLLFNRDGKLLFGRISFLLQCFGVTATIFV